jgi:HTH-type transcriptional regulator / antitoxin HipB
MRIRNSLDLGLFIRQTRRDLGKTQAELAAEAGVSRRWLAALEAGKATAEFGLVLRTLHALGLVLDTSPRVAGPDDIDLDAIIDNHRRRRA